MIIYYLLREHSDQSDEIPIHHHMYNAYTLLMSINIKDLPLNYNVCAC